MVWKVKVISCVVSAANLRVLIVDAGKSLSLHCRKEPKLLGRAFLFHSFGPESKESNLPHPLVELLCSPDSYVQPRLLESGRRLWVIRWILR